MEVHQTLIHEAIAALRALNRREAVALVRRYMDEHREPSERWRSVSQLCGKIGEIDLAVEAARRYAAIRPRTLERVLHYCSELATRGRFRECLREIGTLPAELEDNTAILHLRATLALQLGDFATAEPLTRRTIDQSPLTGQNWLQLSIMKKFRPGDPDLARMESLRSQMASTPDVSQATFFYALGKAYHDAGDSERAIRAYEEGAAIKRRLEPYDAAARDAYTKKLISGFSAESLGALTPSQCASERAIFVTGLPRSGTTLVEQILTSHSAVADGAELGLFQAALLPAGDFQIEGARAYEKRSPDVDPWGAIAEDYLGMLAQRFGPEGRIVDKTLNHSRMMGLLLHALPKAKVIWVRRDPADAAISAYRNFFASQVPWSYSFADMARYFRNDDELHEHWSRLFPEQILTVRYEDLVTSPDAEIGRILDHAGLTREEAPFRPHEQGPRTVLTASVAQVRAPISAGQIGAAKRYEPFMREFHEVYYAR